MIKITIEANTNKNLTGIKKFNLINFIIKHSVIYYQSEELQESSPEININNPAAVIDFIEYNINQAINFNMNYKVINDYNIIYHNSEKTKLNNIINPADAIIDLLQENEIISHEEVKI